MRRSSPIGWTIVAGLLLAAGCSGEGGITAVDVGEDAAPEMVQQELPPSVPDVAPETTFELSLPETTPLDLAAEAVVEPGGAGYPCTLGTECNSGMCIYTPAGKQCTVTCDEECPLDWACQPYLPSLPDQVMVCVPRFLDLCRPCRTGEDCRMNGADGGQACIPYGQSGAFCGEPCEVTEDCPEGYSCMDMVDLAGKSVTQCVRVEGECGCTQWDADSGAATDCYVENDAGKCLGERKCLAGGLSPCSAKSPAGETCNGVDDDCDGQADEDTAGGSCLVTNEHGSCPGVLACTGGTSTCEGAQAEAEQCDGLDNNCNGVVDEGFPDANGNGKADCLESDNDADGVPNVLDNCPFAYNPGQADNDMDGMGDTCDADDDNDLSADNLDCGPFDPAMKPGIPELCDGKDNNCNFQVDEGFKDADFDGFADCIDEDDDGDESLDAQDCAPDDPAVHPGAEEACDGKDNNCDFKVDEGYPDADKDGLPDCNDPDGDGDGILDAQDNCKGLSNADQADLDKDGLGDACDADADGDGIPDAGDNCKGLKNPLQGDLDKDGLGDVCDEDDDGDGHADMSDNCPLVANPTQKDSDQDGTGDACEDDKDGDGSADAADCAPLDPLVHPGVAELCDGVDNNCNLSVDEGFPDFDLDGIKNCMDADDDDDGDPDQTDCQPLNAGIHNGAAEVCDGKDNNCAGGVDEGLGTLSCGKGQCAHKVMACLAGKPGSCDPFEGAEQETCDGKDNDCDGLTDEDLGQLSCGKGECAHTVPACAAGVPGECDPFDGAVVEECDGLDNDCDGKLDEDLGQYACGKGLCFHTVKTCVGGETQTCDPFEGAKPEVCDGADNDCDGAVDETLGTTTCGVGPCKHDIPYCAEGKIQVCNPFEGALLEQCDGIDNDCDGVPDEGLGLLSCGLGLCFHSVNACVDGVPQDCDPFEGAAVESCDGADNDCDGSIDEGLGTTTCGLGVCQHSESSCVGGLPNVCDPLKGAEDEVCDALDNDCDGKVDDGFVDTDSDGQADCMDEDDDGDSDPDATDCAPLDGTIGHTVTEVCFNGKDDDCDSLGDDSPSCTDVSCKALKTKFPQAGDGVYYLDSDGANPDPAYKAWCDMTNGAWTLVLKSNGDSTLWYQASYWTDNTLLNEANPGTASGNAKYGAFLKVKVNEMKGCLDGLCYTKSFNGAKTSKEIFAGGQDTVGGHPGFQDGPSWSTQPNCKNFGINTPWNYQQTRFGYTANQEGDCSSNDTAIGFGLGQTPDPAEGSRHGAGYLCLSSNCSKGNVDSGANGLLWVR